MPIFFSRRTLLPLWIAAAFALGATPRLSADLTWTPATGWQDAGAAASGLAGPQGKAALELMNKAKRLEENGSWRSAIGAYEKVATKYRGSVYRPGGPVQGGPPLR